MTTSAPSSYTFLWLCPSVWLQTTSSAQEEMLHLGKEETEHFFPLQTISIWRKWIESKLLAPNRESEPCSPSINSILSRVGLQVSCQERPPNAGIGSIAKKDLKNMVLPCAWENVSLTLIMNPFLYSSSRKLFFFLSFSLLRLWSSQTRTKSHLVGN